MTSQVLPDIEALIRRDPARRGLVACDDALGALCPGHLAQAAAHLARHARCVTIVTGFSIPRGAPPAAETDGPPGALLLARALEQLGAEVFVVTDAPCAAAVAAVARKADFPTDLVLVAPHSAAAWCDAFFETGPGSRLTHLIAVERPGPSHTPESITGQIGSTEQAGAKFLAEVPPESRNSCHNMRGEIIDPHTADLYRLFEQLPARRPEARSIGIGDGANEIGMGSVLWEELVARLDGPHAPRIPCRIAADWTIVAGTSNWGALALAAAILVLHNRTDVLAPWDQRYQHDIMEDMVAHGPAVDGVTGRQEATVDGLPFLTYIQPWVGIRRLLGFDG